KYSRPDIKPHIKITASFIHGNELAHPSANKQHEYHAIKIADNGIGFEKQYETKIFELFQRLHGKNEYSGTGIGLAIVKKIAINHNGFIIAEGKPNIGSTFTIYIPTS
ncbi:MAG: ATP-binding protein, partial [Bacteroidota bacterium]|nr:ATP-binding protein [Bacteroidota bacterium]MDQ3141797.1 ATP-binding protein [Bacteroidota bacterium]